MPDFWKTAARLEEHYGRPSPPAARDPFALVLYENVAYLVSDDRRERAFRELKKRVGLRPADVLTASIWNIDRNHGARRDLRGPSCAAAPGECAAGSRRVRWKPARGVLR